MRAFTAREQAVWLRLLREAGDLGYAVQLAEWVECGDYPGAFLGAIGGICDRERKVIRLKTRDATPYLLIVRLKHELAHARGADVVEGLGRCGGVHAGPGALALWRPS